MKTIRHRRGKLKVVGYETWFESYGINFKGNYRIEVLLDLGIFGDSRFKIYESKKKPLFRNLYLITILFAPITPLVVILLIPTAFVLQYIEGAKNFIRDSAWVNNVRLFNWSNIAIIFLLVIWLFLK